MMISIKIDYFCFEIIDGILYRHVKFEFPLPSLGAIAKVVTFVTSDNVGVSKFPWVHYVHHK